MKGIRLGSYVHMASIGSEIDSYYFFQNSEANRAKY